MKPAKVKNVKENALGEKFGRIHMKKQNLDKMGGRRVTALRDGKRDLTDTSHEAEGSGGGGGGGGDRKRQRSK